jgi:putative Holliday junction resolvase
LGRVLGIDYGDSRVGLALSDPLKIIASPYKTIKNQGSDLLIDDIKNIIIQETIEYIVLGLPIGLRGQETQQTTKVRKFANILSSLDIVIHLQDERLSSISATKSLVQQNIKTGYNKQMIDKTAAAILLQQFIDTRNR